VVLVRNAGGGINFSTAGVVHNHQCRDDLELHARCW
jgi:hypothetical protein